MNFMIVALTVSMILNLGLLLLFLWSESEYRRVLREWGLTINNNEKTLTLLKKFAEENERLMNLMGI